MGVLGPIMRYSWPWILSMMETLKVETSFRLFIKPYLNYLFEIKEALEIKMELVEMS